MNAPSLGNQPTFLNPTLYKMKALQKVKNNLMLTLANYIEQTTNKNDTLAALNNIQSVTCNVITQKVDGEIIHGVTIPNNECNC